MRRGQGGKRTRARKTGPRAPVSTRKPVARSKGSREARGRGARPSRPLDSWPKREESGVCTQELASGDLFEGGVKGRALASSSWPFPFPRCSHLPSVLAWPFGAPASDRSLLPTMNPCPCLVVSGPWLRGLPAPTPSVFTGLWGPAPPAPVQTVVPLARALSCCPGPRADRASRVQADGAEGP